MRNSIVIHALAAAMLFGSALAAPAISDDAHAMTLSWLWMAVGIAFACSGLAAAGRQRFARQPVARRRVRRLPRARVLPR